MRRFAPPVERIAELRGRNPAYRALAIAIRESIAEGDFGEEGRIPTEAELGELYGLSRQTVRRALLELVNDGSIYRIAGRGTFVAHTKPRYLHHLGSIEDLMGLSRDSELEVVLPITDGIDVVAAARLRCDSNLVSRAEVRRLFDNRIMTVTTVWFPTDVAALIRDSDELRFGSVSEHTVIGLLDAKLPYPIAEADQSITAVVATAELSSALRVEPGTPLLRIDRLFLDSQGRPVELATSHWNPELYSYRIQLRRALRPAAL